MARARAVWPSCGGAAVGISALASDHISRLAFQLPIPIPNQYPTIILAPKAVIFLPRLHCSETRRKRRGIGTAIAASSIVGAGMAALPCLGIAATRLPARKAGTPSPAPRVQKQTRKTHDLGYRNTRRSLGSSLCSLLCSL
jgi:NO-binding membrane sensor protein with MHYT domain